MDPDSGEPFDEAVTGDAPNEHSAEGSHPTTDEAGSGNSNFKPSKHGNSEVGIPTNHGADNNQIGTSDAGCENSDSKPSDQGDSEAETADSLEHKSRGLRTTTQNCHHSTLVNT